MSDEVCFVHNGRVLMASEVNGLKHNVIVHAVRRMQGGGQKKAKKSQDRVEFFRDGHPYCESHGSD